VGHGDFHEGKGSCSSVRGSGILQERQFLQFRLEEENKLSERGRTGPGPLTLGRGLYSPVLADLQT